MKKLNTRPALTKAEKEIQLNKLESLIDKIQRNLVVQYQDMPYFHIENTRKRLQRLQTQKMNLHLTPSSF